MLNQELPAGYRLNVLNLNSRPAIPSHQAEAADYMAEMALQMLKLARAQNMVLLARVFELAYYEAYDVAHPIFISADQLEELQALEFKPRPPGPRAYAAHGPRARNGR